MIRLAEAVRHLHLSVHYADAGPVSRDVQRRQDVTSEVAGPLQDLVNCVAVNRFIRWQFQYAIKPGEFPEREAHVLKRCVVFRHYLASRQFSL